MIEILEKGFFTLPVTSRRHALASLGVPAGGPMDAVRYLLANRLVGNPDDVPALEATLILPGIRFADPRTFAVVGGVNSVILRRGGEKHPADRSRRRWHLVAWYLPRRVPFRYNRSDSEQPQGSACS